CKIPFLNGGLFEADYDWEKANISIPNELFRNNEKNKAGDKGTGILDVFDRYNFTIKEDEPLEKEVAVDPEMLGKVFENMLEITERKSKGAFYTPREIVHYMCQESLIHYLDNTLNEYTESYQAFDSDQTSLFGGSTNRKGNLKIELENKGDIRVPKEDIDQLIRQGHLVLEHETTVTGKGKETKSYQYKLPESIRTHAKKLDDALADIKI
ncbi:MAG: class I SAM-dependent DNA methyltransferase, partial [Bacteroidetes bacterium]|nr:class I SAM-dependent DNA methyltransferase [Bacteroidota bacterium]